MPEKSYAITKADSDFISEGQRCSGWLYLPEEVKNSKLIVLDCNHFEPYHGDWFEKIIKEETEFLLNCFDNSV